MVYKTEKLGFTMSATTTTLIQVFTERKVLMKTKK